MWYLKSAPSKLPNCKVLEKKQTKRASFGAKNILFGFFWDKTLAKYCHIWNQHPQIFQISKILKKKMPKFWYWKSLIGYFWPIMPYVCIFGLEVKRKSIVIYEISNLKLVCLQNLGKKQKCLKLRAKTPDLGILGLESENNNVIFQTSTLELAQLQNFKEK